MTTSPSMASTQVASIPELLENILVHLSPGNLLFSRQVHWTFRACINESPTLRHRLFRHKLQSVSGRVHIARLNECSPEFLHDYGVSTGLQLTLDPPDPVVTRCLLQNDRHYDGHGRYHGPRTEFEFFAPTPIHLPPDLTAHAAFSYFNAYLARQTPTVRTTVRITVTNTADIIKPSLEAYWTTASVTLTEATMRELLKTTKGLKKAAWTPQDDKQYKFDWSYDESNLKAYGMGPPSDSFEWRDYFSREQLDKMVEEVEINVEM